MLHLSAPVTLDNKTFFTGMVKVFGKIASRKYDDLLDTACSTIGVDI